MRRRLIALVIALAAVLTACGGTSTDVTQTVDAATAADLLAEGDGVLLDIRTPEEFAAGKIAGSQNIDFYAADFAAQLDRLDKDATYFVYCRSGNRSSQAMDTFEDLGFSQVYEIDGGILNWNAAGLPIVP